MLCMVSEGTIQMRQQTAGHFRVEANGGTGGLVAGGGLAFGSPQKKGPTPLPHPPPAPER